MFHTVCQELSNNENSFSVSLYHSCHFLITVTKSEWYKVKYKGEEKYQREGQRTGAESFYGLSVQILETKKMKSFLLLILPLLTGKKTAATLVHKLNQQLNYIVLNVCIFLLLVVNESKNPPHFVFV